MKTRMLGSIALIALAAGSVADAADYPAAPVKAAPCCAPVWSWTGPYAGVNGGYAWGTLFPPADNASRPSEISLRGGFGGLQAGYNIQVAPHWLFGVEQDIWAGQIRGQVVVPPPIQTYTQESNVGGTIRGRFGYVQDRVLVYSTAGIAWDFHHASLQNLDATQQALAGDDRLSYSDQHLHLGVALGTGVEWAMQQNLSIKAEYLFVYLTKEQYFSASKEQQLLGWQMNTFKIGLNWLLH